MSICLNQILTWLSSFFTIPYLTSHLTSHHYSPFVLQPTRLRSKTLIDNIVFNSLEYHSKSGNLLIEMSDHLMQFLVLEGFVKELKPPKVDLFTRDFKN